MSLPTNSLVRRLVKISCPSGKHSETLVTFRNHSVAAMFCFQCEVAWTESVRHPELAEMERDETDRS